jgi:hypothetical protein
VAAISWYLSATTSGGWRTIDESLASAGKNTDGWVVGTGSTNHSEYEAGVERAATTFTGTGVPDGTLDTSIFDAFRTTDAYSGNFAAANWGFVFSVQATTNGGAQDGRIRFRLIKADADGSNATEITSGQQQASLVSNVATTGTFESSLTFNPGAFSVAGQYLFVQIAWERTGAGGMATSDINWIRGSGTTTGTRITSSDFTANVDTTVNAGSASFSLTPRQAAVSIDRSVDAARHEFTLTAYPASVSVGADTTVSAGVAELALSSHQASVSVDRTVSCGAASFALEPHQSSVAVDRVVSAAAASFALSAHQADIVGGTTVEAGTASLSIQVYSAEVLSDRTIECGVATLTLNAHQAVVISDRLVNAGVAAFALTPHAASVSSDPMVSAGVATLTIQAHPAQVLKDETIAANTSVFALESRAAEIVLDLSIHANVAALSIQAHPASVSTSPDWNIAATAAVLLMSEHRAKVIKPLQTDRVESVSPHVASIIVSPDERRASMTNEQRSSRVR